jgi:hypothetical protein
VTIGAVDPIAKIPEYKVCAVTLASWTGKRDDDEPARRAGAGLVSQPDEGRLVRLEGQFEALQDSAPRRRGCS